MKLWQTWHWLIVTTLIATSVVLGCMSGSAFAQQITDTTNPAYWGATCTKSVLDDTPQSYTPKVKDIDIVVVFNANDYKLYPVGPFKDLRATKDQQTGKPTDITQVIVCTKEPAPSSQPQIKSSADQSTSTATTPTIASSNNLSAPPQPQPTSTSNRPVNPPTSNNVPQTPATQTGMPAAKTMPKTGASQIMLVSLATIACTAGYLLQVQRQARQLEQRTR